MNVGGTARLVQAAVGVGNEDGIDEDEGVPQEGRLRRSPNSSIKLSVVVGGGGSYVGILGLLTRRNRPLNGLCQPVDLDVETQLVSVFVSQLPRRATGSLVECSLLRLPGGSARGS